MTPTRAAAPCGDNPRAPVGGAAPPWSMRLHLNLGSNLGDRHAMLTRAARVLEQTFAPCRATCSPVMETEPWGYDSPNMFLNMGMCIDLPSPLDPGDILERVQQAERSLGTTPHRDSTGAYADRLADIDIIAVDTLGPQGTLWHSLVMDTPQLQLPHPRMHLRDFVLVPMTVLDPFWRHPLLHLTPAQLLSRIRP